MDVHLRDIRYFVVVAEELHFGRAARRLFVSQPAVSRQIAKLERDLGTKLLERDGRRVALTPSGAELLARGRDLLAAWDAAQVAVTARDAAAAATLRVGMQTSIGRGIIPALQAALKSHNPAAGLNLVTVDWDDPTAGLGPGKVDIAIAWLPVPQAASRRLLVLASERRVVAMSADHELAGRTSLTLAEIEAEPFIALPDEAGPLRSFWLAQAERRDPVKIATVARNAEEALEAVSAGLGLVLLSAGNAELYRRDQVAMIPVTDIGPAELALIADATDSRPIIRDLFEALAAAPMSSAFA